MKVIYDANTDVLKIVFRDAPVEDFSNDRPGVTVDYDADDKIIALEIKEASKIMDNPRSLEHTVLG
ncbi:MAG: hypothetical protein Kow00121_53320 [Elainellaceae cyanobacterium]